MRAVHRAALCRAGHALFRRAVLPLLLLSGPAGAETYTFTLDGPESCTASVAPPSPKPLTCRVWKRADLGRFGDATLTALQMIATDADGASRGEVVVTETEAGISRIVTRQQPDHQPDLTDPTWPEADKPPVPYLDAAWSVAAAASGDAIVLWVGGVTNPAFVKLGGRWRETPIREVIAAARTDAKGRLLGQLVDVDPRKMEARFASFEPLEPSRPGAAVRGELAVYRVVVHPSGVLELGERLPAKPLPADWPEASADAPATPRMRFEAGGTASCSVSAYADDSDPAGVNIRASASASSRVLAKAPTLKGYGMDLEISGAKDGWFRVEKGEYPLGTEELGPKAAKKFSGTGWVHGSKLATSPTFRELYVLPHPLAAIVARIDNAPGGSSLLDAPGAGQAQGLRSCLGRWIEMDVRMPSGAVHRGWMPRHCANQLTTCG